MPLRVSPRVRWACAVLAAAALALPHPSTATTAAVLVPPTLSDYQLIGIVGGSLLAVDSALGPDGVTVVGVTAWLAGAADGRTVRARFGAGDPAQNWVPCTAGPVRAGPSTGYVCVRPDTGGERSPDLHLDVSP